MTGSLVQWLFSLEITFLIMSDSLWLPCLPLIWSCLWSDPGSSPSLLVMQEKNSSVWMQPESIHSAIRLLTILSRREFDHLAPGLILLFVIDCAICASILRVAPSKARRAFCLSTALQRVRFSSFHLFGENCSYLLSSSHELDLGHWKWSPQDKYSDIENLCCIWYQGKKHTKVKLTRDSGTVPQSTKLWFEKRLMFVNVASVWVVSPGCKLCLFAVLFTFFHLENQR